MSETPARWGPNCGPVTISIVIITKDEPTLAATLGALAAQRSVHSVQTLVLEASRVPDLRLRRDHPGVTWLAFCPPPPGTTRKRTTIPEQRNVAVRQSRGEVVVFIDSGCVPSATWLDTLVEPILSGAQAITVGSYASFGPSQYDTLTFTDGYVNEAPTLNMAFRREVFDAVDGFDENFSYGSDVDFCWRVRAAGHRIRMVAAAKVMVDWGGERRQLKRAWYYGAGRARLYRKHPDHLKSLLRDDPILAAYPMFLLGLPLTLGYPAYPLLLAIPLWRSRHSHPVRTLADHLSYGAGALAYLARIAP